MDRRSKRLPPAKYYVFTNKFFVLSINQLKKKKNQTCEILCNEDGLQVAVENLDQPRDMTALLQSSKELGFLIVLKPGVLHHM